MPFDPKLHVFNSPGFQKTLDKAVTFIEHTPVYKLPAPDENNVARAELPPFSGAGVYALYYIGDFLAYAPLAKLNKKECVYPIYVGTAVPPGWRKGRDINAQARTLYNRLKQHARSISDAKASLKVEDFLCRFMIFNGAASKMITVVESELINKYRPLWNSVIDGFGNHPVGVKRLNQKAASWDILHSGRPGRAGEEAAEVGELLAKIRRALESLSLS